MNTNKEEKKRRRKIRQSYHTKFTRFKNASATGGVCFHLIIIYKRKKKEEAAAAAATNECFSLTFVNKHKSIDK
jgi:hypothetical protein